MSSLLWQLLLQIFLILLNAVFACAEIAVIAMNDTKLAQLTAQGNKQAIRVSRLVSKPAQFLATIQVAITLSGFLGSAFAADNFASRLVDLLVSLGVTIPQDTLKSIAVVVITLILSYFTLIFGELVPKRLAMKKAESIALKISALVSFISTVFSPIVWFLTASTNLVLRLLGVDPNSEEDDVSEEEIRMLVDKGNEKGIIDSDEKEIIQNVFEFDDLMVGEFATHRTEVDILWNDETVQQWEAEINSSRHSYYPVCGESADDVIGVLNAKDFFRLNDKSKEEIIRGSVEPAYFVPESIKADILFKQMKKSRNHFAVVLDEYGGMMGIITMYDLIEQILGDMDTDDNGDNGPDFENIEPNKWKIKGYTRLDDLVEPLGVKLPIDEYDTFGGYVFGIYGFIPDDGVKFEVSTNDLKIEVLEINEHKLVNAIVTVKDNTTK